MNNAPAPHAPITHRDQKGPTYKGVAIHAPSELHERACELALQHFDMAHPILELGAGSGALSLRLSDAGFAVIPVDLDGGDWKPAIPLKLADFNVEGWHTSLFPNQHFKHIVALEVIEHLENPSKFFRDIAALLEPHGQLILSTPNIFSFHSVHAAVKRAELALFSADDCVSSGHISILPWWLLTHLAQRCGLEIVYCSSVCDIPVRRHKRMLVHLAKFLRNRLCKPQGIDNIDGLNVITVFRKS